MQSHMQVGHYQKQKNDIVLQRKELLALVHFVKYFRNYLYGHEFTARTDHGSLRWLANFKDPEGQLARWLETLSSYSMKIEHRPGRLHRNADGLSLIPCKQCGRREVDADPKHTILAHSYRALRVKQALLQTTLVDKAKTKVYSIGVRIIAARKHKLWIYKTIPQDNLFYEFGYLTD